MGSEGRPGRPVDGHRGIGEVVGLDDDVDVIEGSQGQQLAQAEGSMFGATPTEDDDIPNRVVRQRVKCVIGDVGVPHLAAEQ